MRLKYYLDTHIAKQIALQLRQKGIEVVRCEEVGMAQASDAEHLAYATRMNCAPVSVADDFQALHKHYIDTNQRHCGIFNISHHLLGPAHLGRIIKELTTCSMDFRKLRKPRRRQSLCGSGLLL